MKKYLYFNFYKIKNMMWITHIAFSIFIIKLFEIITLHSITNNYNSYIIIIIYSILPDIDMYLNVEHRTYTHTIYSSILVSIPLLFIDFYNNENILNIDLFLAGFLSYLAHITADMMTKSGVRLLYPFKKSRFFLLPAHLRFKTASSTEYIILIILILLNSVIINYYHIVELAKISAYINDNLIYISLSYSENNIEKMFDYCKVVSIDENYLYVLHNNIIYKINKNNIKEIKILKMERKNKDVIERIVKLKRLKSIYYNDIIIGYIILDKNYKNCELFYKEFFGTGKQLYYHLKYKHNLSDDTKLKIKIIIYS